MKWRTRPESSRRWRAMAGNFCSSSASSSARVAGAHSRDAEPFVKRRKAVGISTMIFISARSSGDSSGSGAGDFGGKGGIEIGFERREARFDSGAGCEFAGEGIGGFQAVAGDAQDGSFVGLDAALGDEFLRDGGGDPAGSLRENPFGFGQGAHGANNFRVRNIFGPSARGADDFDGVVSVGRIADGQGARDGSGLLRIEAVFRVLDRVG